MNDMSTFNWVSFPEAGTFLAPSDIAFFRQIADADTDGYSLGLTIVMAVANQTGSPAGQRLLSELTTGKHFSDSWEKAFMASPQTRIIAILAQDLVRTLAAVRAVRPDDAAEDNPYQIAAMILVSSQEKRAEIVRIIRDEIMGHPGLKGRPGMIDTIRSELVRNAIVRRLSGMI